MAVTEPSEDAVFDVLDISDLRFPGGTSHSIAEEVTAQFRAGLRTGLVHLAGPLVTKVLPVNRVLRRLVERCEAELLIAPDHVRADITVFRHPAVIQHAAEQLPVIDTGEVVVVVNAGAHDSQGKRHYDPRVVNEIVQERFGRLPLWAPIGPQVRQEIAAVVPERLITREDWVNIIDVDAWRVPRAGWQGELPVVGRHSRPSPQKWPADTDTLLKVYPVDGRWDVRVLGGAQPVEHLLGRTPEHWDVLPFGAVSPQEFLASLDFFIYCHHENWVEAFGRTILEAMASGVLAVLPPHFRELFGEAAIYAEPDEVQSTVESLRRDRPAYERQVARAEQRVRTSFGHEAHVDRLCDLTGRQLRTRQPRPDPSRTHEELPPRLSLAAVEPRRRLGAHRPRVLLISSNGAGMGHLTRLLSYARHVRDSADVYFLSLSQAAPVVGRLGYPYEYLPSARTLGMPPKRWHKLFAQRVTETLGRIRPDVIVFDGTWPYAGIEVLRHRHPGIRWIWSRRGMWREGANVEQIEKSAWFDSVLEPGDFASAYDLGATATAGAHRVGPVTLLNRDDLDDRSLAREALGLPPEGPLALVSLGAGTINDTTADLGAAVTALRRLRVGVCVTRPEIAVSAAAAGQDVHVVSDYPLSRRYAAFDVVVSASGYNSFHELLRLGVPSLFVPNPDTMLDDQDARARFAADRGWGHRLASGGLTETEPLLADLLARGRSMVAGVQDDGNGAVEAARHIVRVATGEVAR